MQTTEQLPWYRALDYKGKMADADKRQLDSFRMLAQHPSAREEDLPHEVQSYIGSIETELYDLKQEKAVSRAFIKSAFAAALLYVSYYGIRPTESIWSYLAGLVLLIAPWFFYRREWRKNAEDFLPDDPSATTATNERIKREWESNYIVRLKRAERGRKTGDK